MSNNSIPAAISKVLGETLFVERKISNITSGWARNSNWDARMCARDLFQNFYDGATESGKAINDISANTLDKNTFAFYLADVTFDVRRLFYLGSEKDGVSTIGQVGEGFKLATLTLLRDFNVRVFAASGDQMLEISLSDDVIEQEINLHPMQYDYYKLSTPCNGNYLFIHGASKELVKALESSRYEFYYTEHPACGDLLGLSGNDVLLFKRTSAIFGIYTDKEDGLVFYHDQLRAVLPKANVVIVINKRWKTIDNKIGQDRDRTFFGDKLKDSLLKLAMNNICHYAMEEDFIELLDVSKASLPNGNSFLSAIVLHSSYRLEHEFREKLREQFLGKVYGAIHDHHIRNYELLEKVKQLETDGYKAVPRYMTFFGALNIHELIENDKKQMAMEVIESGSRQPTNTEMLMIGECFKLVAEYINKSNYEYHVFTSKQLLGQFKENHEVGHHRRTSQIYLSQDIFVGTPGEFVSTLLHEVAHITGYDGSRHFTDALTNIIGLIIDSQGKIGDAVKNIKVFMDMVRKERIDNGVNMNAIQELLQRKNPEEMCRVLSKVPFDVLNEIIGDAKKPA